MSKDEKKIVYIPVWTKTKQMLKELADKNMDSVAKTIHLSVEKTYLEDKLKSTGGGTIATA